MDSFPPEIWHKIFILLSLKERVECTLVCRKWWHILDNYSLYHNVEIRQQNQFRSFISLMERSAGHAAQVDQLILMKCIPDDFNKRKLFNIFPNVRILKTEHDLEDYPSSQPIPFAHSKSKLELLSDSGFCDLASQMFSSNLFERLGTLQLNFLDLSECTLNIICQLKDLPVLKKVTFTRAKLGIMELERLHSSLSSIQDFTLDGISIMASEKPSCIVPATSISVFEISIFQAENIETHIQFYQYMTKKYTNINNDVEYSDNQLATYSSSEARRVYLDSIIDFYKLIGPYQKKLLLTSVPDGVDIFEALDSVDCHFEKLECLNSDDEAVFQCLSRSKQSNYIQIVTILGAKSGSSHLFSNIKTLKTLNLYYFNMEHTPISNLVGFLKDCPVTLKDFSISCFSLNVVPSHLYQSSIEDLYIRCDVLSKGLADAISSCFPKLAKLELRGAVKENINISLRNPSLQYATLNIIHSHHHGFSFQCPNQSEPQHYLFHKEKVFRVPYQKIQDLPTLSVISSTEKIVEFFNGGIKIR